MIFDFADFIIEGAMLISLVGYFFIGSNDETFLVVQEKSKNSGL